MSWAFEIYCLSVLHVNKISEVNGDLKPLHIDKQDISCSCGFYLGDFTGCFLECYAEDGKTLLGTFGESSQVFQFDARLPHCVVTSRYSGCHFACMIFKSYDQLFHTQPPFLTNPCYVNLARLDTQVPSICNEVLRRNCGGQ